MSRVTMTFRHPLPAVQDDHCPDAGSAGDVRGQSVRAGAAAAGAGEASRGAEEAAGRLAALPGRNAAVPSPVPINKNEP